MKQVGNEAHVERERNKKQRAPIERVVMPG